MGMTPSSGLSVPSMPPGMPPLILPPSMAGINAIPSSNMTTKSLPEVADGDGLTGGYHRSRGPASSGVVGGPGSTKTNGSRSGGETTVDAKGTQSLLSGANGKSSTSLTVASDMASVVHDMLMSDSGLEIRDRTWLKITIPNAFIGEFHSLICDLCTLVLHRFICLPINTCKVCGYWEIFWCLICIQNHLCFSIFHDP